MYAPTKAPVLTTAKQELCDRCHVALAKFEVITPKGPLYFCGHHMRILRMYFELRKYQINEWRDKK